MLVLHGSGPTQKGIVAHTAGLWTLDVIIFRRMRGPVAPFMITGWECE